VFVHWHCKQRCRGGCWLLEAMLLHFNFRFAKPGQSEALWPLLRPGHFSQAPITTFSTNMYLGAPLSTNTAVMWWKHFGLVHSPFQSSCFIAAEWLDPSSRIRLINSMASSPGCVETATAPSSSHKLPTRHAILSQRCDSDVPMIASTRHTLQTPMASNCSRGPGVIRLFAKLSQTTKHLLQLHMSA
jgi:hypothetical protein